ncbi:MAG TPA: hypothetical protein VK974_03130 [Methylophilaceae bacterium]|nr:hypothetical protein [Methylophilaceae bacterium]
MLKIRIVFITLAMLFVSTANSADVRVSIGINFPVYPQLVVVPGYPVYYAPNLQANFFFYDGMYWIYQDDNWYSSSWYNGPWWFVEPEYVPVFVLRIPVRYYRQPPPYFYGWRREAPPRWGEHWGRDWEQRRGSWDKWNHHATPAPAPLPTYQKQYSGERYPREVEQQHELQQEKYRYQPRDPKVQENYKQQVEQTPGQQREFKQKNPSEKNPSEQEDRSYKQESIQRNNPESPRQRQQDEESYQRPQQQQRDFEQPQRPDPEYRRQQPQPGMSSREQQMPRPQGQQERQQSRDQGRERGQGRDKN